MPSVPRLVHQPPIPFIKLKFVAFSAVSSVIFDLRLPYLMLMVKIHIQAMVELNDGKPRKKPLLESGTLGAKYNSQMVMPHLAEAAAAAASPAGQPAGMALQHTALS
ncbi:unnamed protein product [Urochloa humidicola]